MKAHIQRVQHSSAKSDWRTPPALYQALDAEFHFSLDAAADQRNHLARYWFGPGGLEPNGLAATAWRDYAHDPDEPFRRAVFMNPPYAKAEGLPIEPWIRKAWEESQQGATVVGVLPFNPQTAWYRGWVCGVGTFQEANGFWAAQEERRLSHRVTFNRPDGTPADNAPGNTVIVIWQPTTGYAGPWQPAVRYWSYR